MDLSGFDKELADALADFNESVRSSSDSKEKFKEDPTVSARSVLAARGIKVADCFHAHAIAIGESLPAEPDRATKDRFIYVFKDSGLFEFKIVPGSSTGDDSIMYDPKGACHCCNCCVLEV